MKLLTYKEKNNSSAKFGFKVESQIIDISRAAKWVNENQNNDDFLLIPNTLKETLIDWDKNFLLLKISIGLLSLTLPKLNLFVGVSSQQSGTEPSFKMINLSVTI